ncbi:c-type cytochrome [Halomonas piscis]|uniref:C-type cytochrome n=1 Tax=Halomonas piscis TaxID=3031727 RepID=A0ABY9Z2J0_9GAMM|nr:c-type cytochrome [Halomonas piscis]WNK21347.1 c-type cytochrome [Halomonas piscis]
MRTWITPGRLAGLSALAAAGLGLAMLTYGQGEPPTDEPSAESTARDADKQSIDSPLAAVYFAQQAFSANIKLAGPLVGIGTDRDWACGTCHGHGAQGAENVPRLAGQPAGYITKQLHDYASGRRQNDNMRYIAQGLSAEEMAALGQFYSSMNTSSTASPRLNGDLERGRELALQGDWNLDVPACFTCHGSSAWGVGQGFPALAGQHPSYLYTQLAGWEAGRRSNSPGRLMHSVASALSDDDMRSVADFMATLPAPPARQSTRLETPAPERLTTSAQADSQGGSDEHE